MPYDEYLKSKSKLKVYTYFWDTLYFALFFAYFTWIGVLIVIFALMSNDVLRAVI